MNKRILVIDDDPDILHAMQMLLELQDFSVTTASCQEEAEVLSHNSPDLILMDVWLAGKDGRQIAKRLKNQSTTKHIPILMMSAHPTVYKTIMQYQVDDFIPKPFDIDFLMKKINHYI